MVVRYGQQASYQQFFNTPLLQKLDIGEHELGGSNGTSIEMYLKVYALVANRSRLGLE
jgi:hypothetical protein